MKKNLAAGLALLLPITISLALLNIVINFFTYPFINFVSNFLENENILQGKVLFLSHEKLILILSKIVVLVLLFALTAFLGLLTRLFIAKYILSLTDKILQNIPIFKTIYTTTQEVIKTLFSSHHTAFKQVVLAPFPHPGTYVIGLVSEAAPQIMSASEKTISVLIITTPNPTSGFVLMYEQKELVYLSISPESALKYVISGGILSPKPEQLS